jgi:hypothetical protein
VVREYETRIFTDDQAFLLSLKFAPHLTPLPDNKEASTFPKRRKTERKKEKKKEVAVSYSCKTLKGAWSF